MSDDLSAPSQAVLLADGLGCAAAAAAVSVPGVYRMVDPELTTQAAVRAGLLVTSGVCLFGAVNSPRWALRAAALINAGWVGACLYSLRKQHTLVGRALIAGTAVFDAAAGCSQWWLGRRLNRAESTRVPS